MLLSMTGYGEAHVQRDDIGVWVEVRTINSRYFKLTLKCLEGYNALEPEIEHAVRDQIRRGSVQVALRVDRLKPTETARINEALMEAYFRQLSDLLGKWNVTEPVPIGALLQLPGVADDYQASAETLAKDWPAIEHTLKAALENLAQMRIKEGAAMAADLADNSGRIARELEEIDRRAPNVAQAHRTRLTERLQKTLDEFQITLEPQDLIKEVSIFAERSDISEEIVRLRSHLEQFEQLLAAEESSGRKLEFLTQEMFREANTIGSKANDVTISRHTIEIKASIERIREMIQNVE